MSRAFSLVPDPAELDDAEWREHEHQRWNKKQTTLALAETAPVLEGNGVPDDVAKDATVGAVNSQAEAIDGRELKAILEAVLFVSPEPVPVARLVSILGTVSKAEVVQSLGDSHARFGSGWARHSACAGCRRVSAGDEAGVWALAETDG